MLSIKKILIIVQRSNGDVYLSSPLISALYAHYDNPQIDLLVNDDTLATAKTLKHIHQILLFSYQKKKDNRLAQEIDIIKSLYKKYDLSINLTASDRSVLYAVMAAKHSISAVEKDQKKSWWKSLFLTQSYFFDRSTPIVINNTMSLALLGIRNDRIEVESNHSLESSKKVDQLLKSKNINQFLLFHPSAQYQYKIYPKAMRNQLFKLLDDLEIPIVVTGSKNAIDQQIKEELPDLNNLYDFIGETNLDEYMALSDRSEAYIGMDTLNMHIAASQNKRIFAIFGPTLLDIWSPWCNSLQTNTAENKPKQTYGNITIFQADMDCVACGLAGCDDKHGKSECLYKIAPEVIFNEVKSWLEEKHRKLQ